MSLNTHEGKMKSESTFSIPNPKIDPGLKPVTALKPDGSPDDNDRIEFGPTALAFQEWQTWVLLCLTWIKCGKRAWIDWPVSFENATMPGR